MKQIFSFNKVCEFLYNNYLNNLNDLRKAQYLNDYRSMYFHSINQLYYTVRDIIHNY